MVLNIIRNNLSCVDHRKRSVMNGLFSTYVLRNSIKKVLPPLFKKGFFYHFKVCKNNIFEQICTPCIADCCSGSVPPDGRRSRRALHHTHGDEDTRPLKQRLTRRRRAAHRGSPSSTSSSHIG